MTLYKFTPVYIPNKPGIGLGIKVKVCKVVEIGIKMLFLMKAP